MAVIESLTVNEFVAPDGSTWTFGKDGSFASNKKNAIAAPGTIRDIVGSITTGVSVTSGTNFSLVGVRGLVTITNGTTAGAGSFLYGTQGKIIGGTGTIDVGSGHVAALYGQLDLLGTTDTSGHIAAVIADVANVGSNGALVDNIYAEQVTGTANNSAFKAIVNSTYIFDLSSAAGATNCSSTSASVTNVGSKGWLKVFVNGAVRYIALGDGVS